MPSTELPITSTPMSSANSASSAGNTADNAEDAAAQTQTFMLTLAQLLDDGAVVVAAPTQAAVQTAKATDDDTSDSDILGATPAGDALIAMLLPSQGPLASNADSTGDNAKSVSSDLLPLLAANAATLQKKNGSASADGVGVAMEFETTLTAQAADALLAGADKTKSANALDADALAALSDKADRLTNNGLQTQSTATARPMLTTDVRVGTQTWPDELAAKAMFVHERGMHTASLRLSPEHLGPMEIQISVKDDKASVWFGATHAETRAALEHAMPRLRELLGSQGLTLSDAGVFREPPREQARNYVAARRDSGPSMSVTEHDIVIGKRNGLLDAYA